MNLRQRIEKLAAKLPPEPETIIVNFVGSDGRPWMRLTLPADRNCSIEERFKDRRLVFRERRYPGNRGEIEVDEETGALGAV